MTKKAASKKAASKKAAPRTAFRAASRAALKTVSAPPNLLVSPLRTLLHTMRCVAQHEDALCTLLHSLQHHPEHLAELTAELRLLLDQLPARDYIDDLDAVLHALSETTRSPRSATK